MIAFIKTLFESIKQENIAEAHKEGFASVMVAFHIDQMPLAELKERVADCDDTAFKDGGLHALYNIEHCYIGLAKTSTNKHPFINPNAV